MALLCHPHRLEGNLNALAFLPLHCNTRILLDPTYCPWYPLYPLLGFYLTGTIASDPVTAKQCLYNMDRESLRMCRRSRRKALRLTCAASLRASWTSFPPSRSDWKRATALC